MISGDMNMISKTGTDQGKYEHDQTNRDRIHGDRKRIKETETVKC